MNDIKPASSILLLKEAKESLPEFFMVVRHHKIDVASGALVFPGGKVETQDQPELFDLPSHQHEASLLPFAIACIREVFEETGVLFARKNGSEELLNAQTLDSLEHYRSALVDETISFSEFCRKENISLAVDHLLHFAHWITPEMAPKRFDTHFFIALAPEDQVALHDGYESVDSIWKDARELLKEHNQGLWKIVFPTRMNLEKLARFETFMDIKNYLETTGVCTVQPEFLNSEEGKFMCIPKEADYPQWKVPIEKVMTP